MIRTSLAALAIAGVAVSSAYAAEGAGLARVETAAYDVAEGTVESVDVNKSQFTLKAGDRTQTVTVTKDTSYMLDGQSSTRDAVLKPGAKVTVTHTAGTATRVEAKSRALAAAYDVAEGTIQSIDVNNNQFTLKVGDRTQTVKVTQTTSYMLDGQASTRDAVLKTGAKVTVTHSGGTATRVEAKSK